MKKTLIVIGIVGIILLSLFAVQRGGTRENMQDNTESILQEQSESAQIVDDSMDDTNGEKKAENNNANIPENTQLSAVGDYTGSGVATRVVNDAKFTHTVTADIEDPAEGKFYEGWLVDGRSFFSTGKMIKDDGQYYLEYISDEDQSAFDQVVITEETLADGLDGKPEAHVLEGSF